MQPHAVSKSLSGSVSKSAFRKIFDYDSDTDSDALDKQDAVKACSTEYLVNKYTTPASGNHSL
jgi:hypothetical protein